MYERPEIAAVIAVVVGARGGQDWGGGFDLFASRASRRISAEVAVASDLQPRQINTNYLDFCILSCVRDALLAGSQHGTGNTRNESGSSKSMAYSFSTNIFMLRAHSATVLTPTRISPRRLVGFPKHCHIIQISWTLGSSSRYSTRIIT